MHYTYHQCDTVWVTVLKLLGAVHKGCRKKNRPFLIPSPCPHLSSWGRPPCGRPQVHDRAWPICMPIRGMYVLLQCLVDILTSKCSEPTSEYVCLAGENYRLSSQLRSISVVLRAIFWHFQTILGPFSTAMRTSAWPLTSPPCPPLSYLHWLTLPSCGCPLWMAPSHFDSVYSRSITT